MHHYLVRLGAMAELYAITTPLRLPGHRRVLVRTSRGVELGELVSGQPRSESAAFAKVDFVRCTTSEDDFLIARLDRYKCEAVEACRELLTESESSAILLDVDQLFDGGTLLLHFLGPVDACADEITRQVVARYEQVARIGEFATLLETGCGPACGTDEGGGCGDTCAGCAVASACRQD